MDHGLICSTSVLWTIHCTIVLAASCNNVLGPPQYRRVIILNIAHKGINMCLVKTNAASLIMRPMKSHTVQSLTKWHVKYQNQRQNKEREREREREEQIQMETQSILVISKLKGPSETL